MLKNHKINPKKKASSLKEVWSPHIIAQIDNLYLKVVKLKGELVWHKHDHEDEMFMVLAGQLQIKLENNSITLHAGDVYVVSSDTLHSPVAKQECLIMLIESSSTKHTGSTIHPMTKSLSQQLENFEN